MKKQLQEVQVSYRRPDNKADYLKIRSSQEAYDILRSVWNDETISMYEEFYVLYLDRANHVLGYRLIGRGTTSACLVSSKIILSIGLQCHSSGIILAHYVKYMVM